MKRTSDDFKQLIAELEAAAETVQETVWLFNNALYNWMITFLTEENILC